MSERKRERENAWITFRKKKHPEPPLSHILAYPMVANMAGSGVQERVRVSAVRVRGKRRACAIAEGLPCRRTRRSSMSEYRPGVTSPHTLSQRALPLPPPSLSLHPDVPYLTALLTRSAPLRPLPPPSHTLEHSYYLATYLQRDAPPLPLHPLRAHSISLRRARYFFPATSFLFSHYLGLFCLRCPSGPLSFRRPPSSSRTALPPILRGYSPSPPSGGGKCSPQVFPSVSAISAISFTPFYSD